MDQESNRWETARTELTRRWQAILGKIDEKDEGGILQLSSVMDEFCDEADQSLHEPGHEGQVPGLDHRLSPPGGSHPVGERCLFCRGFMELGGCYGTLDLLNKAVFDRKWDEARRIATDYVAKLRSLSPMEPGDPSLPVAG
jgi:hypothetical protein